MAGLAHDIKENLFSHPWRVALTGSAIAVGIFSLTVLMGILSGLQNRATRLVSDIGADVIAVYAERNGETMLRQETAAKVRHLFPDASVAMFSQRAPGNVSGVEGVAVLQTDTAYSAVRNWFLVEGRFLDPIDSRSDEPNCLVSVDLSERLGLVPGTALTLDRTLYRVAGVVRGNGGIPGGAAGSSARFVVLPMPPAAAGSVDSILIKHTGQPPEEVWTRIQRDLIREEADAEWSCITPEHLVAETRKLIRSVQLTYGTVAGLCLLLGGVTLMSFMTLNVRQRLREIGLRRALGASRFDIFLLFQAEGMIMTTFAGLLGGLPALAVLNTVGHELDLPMETDPAFAAIGVVIAMAMGALFSWGPARSAAAMNPADALRD